MTEPQTWTLIGTFAAAVFGMLAFMMVVIGRMFTAQTAVFRAELNALEARMDAKLNTINSKIEALDRDIQAIARHVFGEPA